MHHLGLWARLAVSSRAAVLHEQQQQQQHSDSSTAEQELHCKAAQLMSAAVPPVSDSLQQAGSCCWYCLWLALVAYSNSTAANAIV